MIGIVIVSHSAGLAAGVCELAAQMAQDKVRLAAAGGTGDANHPIGTDALKVLEAIQSVYSEDGVLVLMDLGSAVLSAEMALELLEAERRANVRLCAAPLVEGCIAAAGQALAGAGLEQVAREAGNALSAKTVHLQTPPPAPAAPVAGEIEVTVPNALGLHARPAVLIVRAAARAQADVNLRNITAGRGPVSASSINGLLSLAARRGHRLGISAQGPDARRALEELAALVESGFGEMEVLRPAAPAGVPLQPAQCELAGNPASPGIAVGPIAHFSYPPIQAPPGRAENPEAEWQRLHKAVQAAREQIGDLCAWARRQAGERDAAIFDAQLLFLEDPELHQRVHTRIFTEYENAARAWQASVTDAAGRLRDLGDDYLEARAADVLDVGQRVLRILAGAAPVLPQLGRPVILAARDLAPSEVKDLDRNRVLGLCLEAGSAGAHSTILARAMGIPVVVGMGPALSLLAEGTMVGLDGERGIVCVSPDPDQLSRFEEQRRAWLAAREAARAGRHLPARTLDGRHVRLLANIGSVEEAAQAVELGAEGVGVLRTEFLFLNRAAAPSEEEQYEAYAAIARSLESRPLVIRTLDAGGDKPLPYVPLAEEANPFLGWRGIRVTLARSELLKTQLRAILRAGQGHRVEILLPMISSPAEVRAAKAILNEAKAELDRAAAAFNDRARLGLMIEVPAAVVLSDRLAGEADFFSIGTNDLAQYVMAADRTNPRVAAAADPLQPAVLRMILQAVEAARTAGIGVTLCGELAAEPLAAPLLIGMGLDELSLSAPLIPGVKQAIGRVDSSEAARVASDALRLNSSGEIRALLNASTSR